MNTITKKNEKPRAKNFTSDEIAILVQEIEKRRKFLFGPLKGPNYTQFHRDRAWETVLQAINSVAPVRRTLEEIKKKFKDLKSRTKQKVNALKKEVRKTGGGQVDEVDLTATEEVVLSFIGEDSVSGIKGGIDTLRPISMNLPSPPAIPEDPQAFISPPHIQISPQLHSDPQPSTSSLVSTTNTQNDSDHIQITDSIPSTDTQIATVTNTTINTPSLTHAPTHSKTKKRKLGTKEKALQALNQTNIDAQKHTEILLEIKSLLAEEVQLKKRKLEMYEYFQNEKLKLKRQKLLLLQNRT